MDNIIERGRLYDYYGALLTEHQRQIYEAVVYEDMALAEIAQEYDISRQGVHDLIHRCDKQLARYEDKLNLIDRDEKIHEKLNKIRDITADKEILDSVEDIRGLL